MTAIQIVAWVPAAIWVYLVGFRGLFWLPTVRLPDQTVQPDRWPTVAVVVPARNEADIIAETLSCLIRQDYPGRASVYLVDDCSDDGTGQVAEACAREARTGAGPGGGEGTGLSLTVVESGERPPGWVGKTWALAQGVAAATADLDPDFVLFTDADIAHPADSLTRLVCSADAGAWDLVSLMARLRVRTTWEKLIVPAFVYFFSQLYPFRAVARRRSRTAGAAGGCVLVRRCALERAGGVAAISGAVIDDVALGRAVKRSGGSTWLGYADQVRSVRPYPRLADLWDMVARSAYTQLRCSPAALAATVVGLAVIYIGPVAVTAAGAVAGDGWMVAAGALAWLLLTGSYLPMVRYYRVGAGWALTLPAAAVLYGAMTVDSARRHRRRAGAAWKGRTYAGETLSG